MQFDIDRVTIAYTPVRTAAEAPLRPTLLAELQSK